MPTISVVIPATDAPPTLPSCLAAIERAAAGPEEVVVIDGPAHLSASAARNEGVERASGEIVVFVDADVEVHPDVFERIRRTFEADPELTALFGSYDDRPSAPGTVSAFRNLLHHYVHQHGAGEAETFWTGLGAVRRRELLAVGGLDAARFPHPSVEDIELGDRLRHAGARIVLDPSIQGTHLKRWTLRSMLWTDFARRGIPWVALQVRNRRPARSLNCGWRHRLSALASALVVAGALTGVVPLLAGSVIALLTLNLGFYALLARRLGMVGAAAGVGLHTLHHLVAIASVFVGVAVALVEPARTARSRRGRPVAVEAAR